MSSDQELVVARALNHYQAAVDWMAQSQYENAILCLNKAIGLHADDASFYTARAQCYMYLCDFQSAILNYKKACLVAHNSYAEHLAHLYYLQGQCFVDQALFNAALENFSRASELNPTTDGYYLGSIVCLFALGYYNDCLTLVNQRIQIHQQRANEDVDKYLADLLTLRARIYVRLSHTTDCYSDVTAVLSIHPSHEEALSLKASLDSTASELKDDAVRLSLLGRYQDALHKLTVAIATNPSLLHLYLLRGTTYRYLGEFNAAIDDFLFVIGHPETTGEWRQSARQQLLLTYNDFAVECISKQFFSEALVLLNKAIKEMKSDKGLYINRAECFYRQGERDFALADFQQALELDPCDKMIALRVSDIYKEKATELFESNNYPEAEKHLNCAIRYDPTAAECLILRTKTRQLLNNMAGARQDAVMALIVDSDNPEVLTLMSRLFPGRTIADIWTSPLAVQVRNKLGVSLAHYRKEKSVLKHVDNELEKPAAMKSRIHHTVPSQKRSAEENNFHMQLVFQKKQMDELVRKVLRSSPTI